jgi:hypothetical protein
MYHPADVRWDVLNDIMSSYYLHNHRIFGLNALGTISARHLQCFIPRSGTELVRELAEIESRREGVPDEIMEGLDFEEEDVDKEEGEVEDIDFGGDDLGGV